jgi:drug/metabolite transporter (DMT)-like permease
VGLDRRVTSARGLAPIAGLVLVYALCYPAIAAGLRDAPPIRFAAMRAAVAGVGLLGLAAATGGPVLPPGRLWPWIGALAAADPLLGYTAMFLGPARAGTAVSAVLGNTGPLFLILLGALFLGEAVTRRKLAALLLGLGGAALVASPAFSAPSLAAAAGAVAPLGAAAGAVAASVLFKRVVVGSGILRVVAWQFALGSLPLLALSAVTEAGSAIAWTPRFVGLLLFLGLVGTGLATALWYRLVKREEVGTLGLYLFLVPVLGFALSALLFGERVGPIRAGGVVLALAGVGLVAGGRRRVTSARVRTGSPGAVLGGLALLAFAAS